MSHFPTFPPTRLYIQPAVTHKTKAMHAGFPHSDILASPFGYQRHQAYRRFPRPSSAPITKASTVRPYQLTQPTTPQNRAISRISHKWSKHNNQTKDRYHHTDTIITRKTHQPITGQHVELRSEEHTSELQSRGHL